MKTRWIFLAVLVVLAVILTIAAAPATETAGLAKAGRVEVPPPVVSIRLGNQAMDQMSIEWLKGIGESLEHYSSTIEAEGFEFFCTDTYRQTCQFSFWNNSSDGYVVTFNGRATLANVPYTLTVDLLESGMSFNSSGIATALTYKLSSTLSPRWTVGQTGTITLTLTPLIPQVPVEIDLAATLEPEWDVITYTYSLGSGAAIDLRPDHYKFFWNSDSATVTQPVTITLAFTPTEAGPGTTVVRWTTRPTGGLWSEVASTTITVAVDAPSPLAISCLDLPNPWFAGEALFRWKVRWGIPSNDPLNPYWSFTSYMWESYTLPVKLSLYGTNFSSHEVFTPTGGITNTFSADPVEGVKYLTLSIPEAWVFAGLVPSEDRALPGPEVCLQRFGRETVVGVSNYTLNYITVTVAGQDHQWFGIQPGRAVQFREGISGSISVANALGSVLGAYWDWQKMDYGAMLETISPTVAFPGDQIQLVGTGFGEPGGYVCFAEETGHGCLFPLSVDSWSRYEIWARLPRDVSAGSYFIAVFPANRASSNFLPLTVFGRLYLPAIFKNH